MFLLQRVRLPCSVLRSKAMLVSQASDPVQMRPSCPAVTPSHPPLQRSLSTSTEPVLDKPSTHDTAPVLWEHTEDSAAGSLCWELPRGSPAQHRAFRILKECKEPWIEKHWVSADGGNKRDTASSLAEMSVFAIPTVSACAAPLPSYCPHSLHGPFSCAFVVIPF